MQETAASHAGCGSNYQPSRAAVSELQRPFITASSDRLALTPHTNPLPNMTGQSSTPRSRQEIRRLFTKRPALRQPANSESALAYLTSVQQPSSRLQNHISSVPAACHPNAGPVHEPHVQTENQHAAETHQHSIPDSVQNQALIGPDADFQAPPMFRQFACPSSSLSAPTSGQRSSGHSSQQQQCTAAQRNSVPAQRTSAASITTFTEGNPASRPSTTSGVGPGGGPMMRAEILMGPAATIEVNVRFHANIAAALKK